MISIPFSGSKKHSVKRVEKIVSEGDYDTVYEIFGGSCVLSANLYNDGLVERAVINDYDGVFDIYEEYLDYKDWLVKKCLEHGIKRRFTCGHFPGMSCYYKDDEGNRHPIQFKLDDSDREYLQSLVSQIPEKFWPLLATGQNFTHQAVSSLSEIELTAFRYFGKYIFTDKQRSYLKVIDRLERVGLDYRDFIKRYESEFNSSSILIVDPPYCDASQGQYKSQFSERQTIDLLKTLKSLDVDFIFFNHDVGRVREWLKEAEISYEVLEQTGKKVTSANHERLDVMVFVRGKNGHQI